MIAAPALRSPRDRRGSIVLVALCFTTVLGIATAGFVTAAYRSMALSHRTFNGARSLQLAEMGLEEALWSLKNHDWTAWSIGGATATRTIAIPAYADGCSGEIHLRVRDYNTGSATIDVEGQTTLPDGSRVRKQLTAGASLAPVFTNAIFSTGTTTFASGGSVDSYNSDASPYSASSAGYSAIVSGSSPSASVVVSGAAIKGYISYAGGAPAFSNSGSLRGPTSPAWTNIDTARYSTSPWQNRPDIKAVTGGSPLPATAGPTAIGTAGATSRTVYYTADLLLRGVDELRIAGPVVIDVRGALTIEASARIVIEPTGSLELHVSSHFFIGGGGIENETRDPKQLALLGTETAEATDTHTVSTATPFHGVIYLPRAPLSFQGNIQLYGAVVAHAVSFSGTNPCLHYDLSLREPAAAAAGLSPTYQLLDWREITDAAEFVSF